MAQKKLIRFEAINSFLNVFQYPKNINGKWKDFFKNDNPIILELACGKGEYTVSLAKKYHQKNYIGVDIKGNRLYIGAKICLDEKIFNAAFLRIQIQKIEEYFNAKEVQEIWITFPDPQLRKSKSKRRLTHPNFLRLYKKILSPGGYIHLKTDSPDLYNFTKRVISHYRLNTISDISDVYKNENIDADVKIKTHYEKLDIAKSNAVFYLCFTLPEILAGNDEKFNEILKNEDLGIYETGIN